MGAAASRPPLLPIDPHASAPLRLFRLAAHVSSTSLRVWLRFLVYVTGLEKHDELLRRLVAQLKYRKYAPPSHPHAVAHGVLITLVELWLRTIRVVLVPDVIARYLCATVLLHIFYELHAGLRGALGRAWLRLTARGRRTLRLRKQLANANSFQERQAIGGELDKIDGKDKWREDPASGLFLYDRVLNKTQMYKVSGGR